jgi:Family of unknown function (DUF6262)
MTDDIRAQRAATLTAAAKAKSEKKTRDAEQAIRRMIKRGEPITFQAVQREASVSHAFLYNHPELRGRIEQLRNQGRPVKPKEPQPDSESILVAALSRQITDLKTQHRQQIQALRDALEQAHGENLNLRRELARRGPTPSPPEPHVASIATTH